MATELVGVFKLVDPPAGQADIVRRAIAAIDYPWELLGPALRRDSDRAIVVEWGDTGQGTSGLAYGATLRIKLSTRAYHLDEGAGFVFAHEVGHLVDRATLTDADRAALTELVHRGPHQPIGHFDHDHPDAGHTSEQWVDGANAYVSRLNESFADLFVAAYAPTIWNGEAGLGGQRFRRFVHWTPDLDAVRSIVTPPAPAPAPPPQEGPAMPSTLIVGTWNLEHDDRATLVPELLKLLSGLDVLIVQEARQYERELRALPGWDYFCGDGGSGQNSTGILVREGLATDSGIALAADKGWFNVKGKRTPPKWLPWVVVAGVLFVGVHQPPTIERRGRHLPVLPPRRWAVAKDTMTAVKLLVGTEGPAIVGGDWNVNALLEKGNPWFPRTFLGRLGMTRDGNRAPTKGRRLIDYLYARGVTAGAATLRPRRGSDHRPVVVSYRLASPAPTTTPEDPMATFQAPAPPYVGPARHTGGNGNKPIKRLVVHGTTGANSCRAGYARLIARYFQTTTRAASCHYIVDPGEVLQAVYDSVVAYHAPPNPGSLGVELCDPVVGPLSRWDDQPHQDMLELATDLFADLCLAYDIPPRFLGPVRLRLGWKGITTHNSVGKAWRQTNHWDPGAWPKHAFMTAVKRKVKAKRAAAAARPVAPPAPQPVPAVPTTPTRITRARDQLDAALDLLDAAVRKANRRGAVKAARDDLQDVLNQLPRR